MSVGPLQPGVSANVPVESVKAMRRRVVSSGASKRLQMSRKPKNTKNMYNHSHYTPMAELKPVVPKTGSHEIHENCVQNSSTPDLSDLPNTKYRVPMGFVDKMLESLIISDRTSKGC